MNINNRTNRKNLNVKLISFSSFAISIILMATSSAFAGADANVNACIYMDVSPLKPIEFKFKAGNKTIDRCMYDEGSDASLVVKGPGVTCTSVGYIRRKSRSSGGDFCLTTAPRWFLGYSAPGTSYSGSAILQLGNPVAKQNYAKLRENTNETFLCGSENLCDLNFIEWSRGTKGPIYVIFNPNKPAQK